MKRPALFSIALGLLGACTSSGPRSIAVPTATSSMFYAADGGIQKANDEDVSAPPVAQSVGANLDHELAKTQVVRLDVQRSDGVVTGSGAVLCSSPNRIWILTARHLLDSKETDAEKQEQRKPRLERIQVAFYKESSELGAPASELEIETSKHRDVALIGVLRGTSATRVPLSKIGRSSELDVGDTLWTYGYHPSGEESWMAKQGTVNRVDEFVTYQPALPIGFSGAPVFDERGAMIGINSHRLGDSGGMADAERAVPIDHVLGELRSSLSRTGCSQLR